VNSWNSSKNFMIRRAFNIATEKRGGWVAGLCILAMLAGCGGPTPVPVEGKVTLDGQPLAGATVILVAKEGPIDERTFSGETDDQGHYSVKRADGRGPGVPPGIYTLKITSVKVPHDADELTPLPAERVPRMYLDGSQTLEVPAEGLTNQDFALEGNSRTRQVGRR
jgi:hypothetical protein